MEFLIILFLLLLNGVFAMYEIALVSSSKIRLETLAEKGSKKARRVIKQRDESEKFLSTIQIGITLIGIVSGAYGGTSIADDIKPLFELIPGVNAVYAGHLAMVTVVVLITYLSIVIGELVPKSIALSDPERYAAKFSGLMQMISVIAYPFVCLLSISTKFLNKVIGMKPEERQMTQDELKMILNQSSEQGVIDQEENEMLRDVFRFSDKRANDLMTPRRDIIALHVTDTPEEVLDTIKEEHFSKYLLVDEDLDQIIGVVSVKDIILMVGSDGREFDLRSIAQPAQLVPESLPAKKVLEVFKRTKDKFAVVINEFGNTEGIITLHDLSESIFGDILEENEEDEEEIIERQDGSLLVDGSMNLEDFMDTMGITDFDDLKEEDFTTLSGMAMFLIGGVPKAGDKFSYQNLDFEIMDTDRGRVDKLLVIKNNKAGEEGNGEDSDSESRE